jgi:hypothetical protein
VTKCYHIHCKFYELTRKSHGPLHNERYEKLCQQHWKVLLALEDAQHLLTKVAVLLKVYQKHSVFCMITKTTVTLKSLALIFCTHIITWSISTKLTLWISVLSYKCARSIANIKQQIWSPRCRVLNILGTTVRISCTKIALYVHQIQTLKTLLLFMNMVSTSDTCSRTRSVNALTCLSVSIEPRYTPTNKEFHVVNVVFSCKVPVHIRGKTVCSHSRKHTTEILKPHETKLVNHTLPTCLPETSFACQIFNYSASQCFLVWLLII